MNHVAYPYRPDERGRTAAAGEARHVRDLVEQLLFTAPGERVNRPEFGGGLRQLLFGPSDETLAAATELTVKSALQQWLADRIDVGDLSVTVSESTVTATVSYVVRRTGQPVTETFER
jgi:uncharacterized protein